MGITVTAMEKKQFVRWFLQHYELKKRESIWLLNYIADDERLMKNVHFIRHAQYCPKAMIMSTLCTKDVPFQYFKKHVMTVDPEKAFHDIRLCREEELFIQLNFKDQHIRPEHGAVLEENPYYERRIREKYADAAESILAGALSDFERQRLLHRVDMALDAGDKEKFYELTEKLPERNHKYSSSQ